MSRCSQRSLPCWAENVAVTFRVTCPTKPCDLTNSLAHHAERDGDCLFAARRATTISVSAEHLQVARSLRDGSRRGETRYYWLRVPAEERPEGLAEFPFERPFKSSAAQVAAIPNEPAPKKPDEHGFDSTGLALMRAGFAVRDRHVSVRKRLAMTKRDSFFRDISTVSENRPTRWTASGFVPRGDDDQLGERNAKRRATLHHGTALHPASIDA